MVGRVETHDAVSKTITPQDMDAKPLSDRPSHWIMWVTPTHGSPVYNVGPDVAGWARAHGWIVIDEAEIPGPQPKPHHDDWSGE